MRCNKCVLSHHTPSIVFDDDGVCNYCHTYQRSTYLGEDELLKVLEGCRNPTSDYDCVVGISGGRDSSYVLLKLVRDYGMRVLAVNYENPFTVPQARTNIENAVRALNVDLVRFADKNDRHRRVLKETVSAWFQNPSPALIPIVCIGCKPAWFEIYRIAKAHKALCIVTGNNPFEVMSFKRELVGISRDEDPRRAFSKYVYSLREILRNRAYLSPVVLRTLAVSYLLGSPYSIGLRLYERHMTWVSIFDYIPWDEQEVLARTGTELGWESPPHLESSWRFDCRVKRLVDFMYMMTLNMTDEEDFYAKMIREGLLTRENALQRLQGKSKIQPDEIRLVLSQAGMEDLSLSQLDWPEAGQTAPSIGTNLR